MLTIKGETEKTARSHPLRQGRRTRIGLLVLIALTVFFALGALFVKYQLEGLRGTLQARAEEAINGKLHVGAVVLNGLRGLRVDRFEATLKNEGGPTFDVVIPQAYVYINLIDLIYGQITIDRVQIDRARVVATRPEDAAWFTIKLPGMDAQDGGKRRVAFRVIGKDCGLEIRNVVGDTHLVLESLDFDVSQPIDAAEVRARVSGLLSGMPEKKIEASLSFASLEDFDFRLRSGAITADDINVFLPSSQRFVQSGAVRPTLRVVGYPNKTLVASLDTPVEHLSVRGQPELLAPATGALSAMATYDIAAHLLTLTTAKVESQQLSGRLDGTISFKEQAPVFDLHAEATEVPMRDAIAYALRGRTESYGELSIDLEDPYQINVGLTGTPETPVLSAEAAVNAGKALIRPKDARLPTAELGFGLMKLRWDSSSPLPSGALNITGGTIEDKPLGVRARNVSGMLTLKDGVVALDPINADIAGNTLAGRAAYNLTTKAAEFSITGALASMEKTPLKQIGDDFRLAGTATGHGTGTFDKGKLSLEMALDLTQAEVDFDWWLRKPIGIGATIKTIKIELDPQKGLKIDGDASIDQTKLAATLQFVEENAKLELDKLHFSMDPLDVPSAGKCIRMPYVASGGTGHEGYVDLQRVPKSPKDKITKTGGRFDDISMQPAGCPVPIHCKNASVDVVISDVVAMPTVNFTVHASEAEIPGLQYKWLVPFRTEESKLEFPSKPDPDNKDDRRRWTIALDADTLSMPPWRGAKFKGQAFTGCGESGLKHFSANVDDGTIEGDFHVREVDNVMDFNARWEGISVTYLLEHFNFPDILKGIITGEVHYTVDNDDPVNTLRGNGTFDIRDGEFNADYVAAKFKKQLKDETAPLPPSLHFSRLKSDIVMEGDLVRTNNILLQSDGIIVTGDGRYEVDGDMDYRLKASITPETARKMPVLQRSFNIEGHRLTQNNIELAFDIKGPTFGPKSAVTGLPSVGVTLVSGAGEMVNQGMKVIDAPRQILLDIFKIFGGIVATSK